MPHKTVLRSMLFEAVHFKRSITKGNNYLITSNHQRWGHLSIEYHIQSVQHYNNYNNIFSARYKHVTLRVSSTIDQWHLLNKNVTLTIICVFKEVNVIHVYVHSVHLWFLLTVLCVRWCSRKAFLEDVS